MTPYDREEFVRTLSSFVGMLGRDAQSDSPSCNNAAKVLVHITTALDLLNAGTDGEPSNIRIEMEKVYDRWHRIAAIAERMFIERHRVSHTSAEVLAHESECFLFNMDSAKQKYLDKERSLLEQKRVAESPSTQAQDPFQPTLLIFPDTKEHRAFFGAPPVLPVGTPLTVGDRTFLRVTEDHSEKQDEPTKKKSRKKSGSTRKRRK